MVKHAKKSDHLQLVEQPQTTTVEIPLPLLGAFANIERSFFDLCIDAGQQVLASMMEQDREDLCGPRWKRAEHEPELAVVEVEAGSNQANRLQGQFHRAL